jgi:transposase
MPKKVTSANHLSVEELHQRYRQSKESSQKIHDQMIWLIALGKTVREVSEITGYSRHWIYQLVRRYNSGGVLALADGRKHNQGKEPLLNDWEQAQLWQVLQDKCPDGGLWNGIKVADWLSQLTGKKISRYRGWEILKQMSFRLRIP